MRLQPGASGFTPEALSQKTRRQTMIGRKIFSYLPLFNPEEGITIVEPLNPGRGWWAGAPSVIYDESEKAFYLYYRLRKPRELGRGAICVIARSEDGIKFEEIWRAKKEDFNSPSIEKSALFISPDGKRRLYISYVDSETNKWRVDMLEGDSFESLDPSKRRKIFTPEDIGVEGVKDPFVIMIGGVYFMILSYAPTPPGVTEELKKKMHETADVYNTGITKSHTGLAVSVDGVNFTWLGDIFSPREEGWDSYASRISTLIHMPPAFIAFYDGSASVEENYEEKTGLAVTFDLRNFIRLTVDGPILTSPHASGSLRYLDAVAVDGKLYCYYEYARSDGSHELRLNIVELRWDTN